MQQGKLSVVQTTKSTENSAANTLDDVAVTDKKVMTVGGKPTYLEHESSPSRRASNIALPLVQNYIEPCLREALSTGQSKWLEKTIQ